MPAGQRLTPSAHTGRAVQRAAERRRHFSRSEERFQRGAPNLVGYPITTASKPTYLLAPPLGELSAKLTERAAEP